MEPWKLFDSNSIMQEAQTDLGFFDHLHQIITVEDITAFFLDKCRKEKYRMVKEWL